jgi:hypothetical protein
MIYSYTISGSARAALRENTAEPVKTTVVYYESYVRECRLAEIRGWRKALALGAAGLAGLSPMKAQAHSPAFMFGGSEGATVEQVVADPEAAAKAAAQKSGLSPDDQGDFEGGWLYAYRLHHGLDPHTGEKLADEPDQATSSSDLSQQIRDAENQLNKTWQGLSPRMKNILRPGEKDWIKEKDAAQPADKLQMIRHQIGFLQNKAAADQAYQQAYQLGSQFKTRYPNLETVNRATIEAIVDRLMDKLDAPGDERGSVEVGFLRGAKLHTSAEQPASQPTPQPTSQHAPNTQQELTIAIKRLAQDIPQEYEDYPYEYKKGVFTGYNWALKRRDAIQRGVKGS